MKVPLKFTGYISRHVVDARLYSLVAISIGLGLESALLFQGVPAGEYAPPLNNCWELSCAVATQLRLLHTTDTIRRSCHIHHHGYQGQECADRVRFYHGQPWRTSHANSKLLLISKDAPTNPRGIPFAPFVDKVEDYVTSRAEVEPTMNKFQEMIA